VRAVLLETKEKPGAKIRISGGGRCNVLPSAFELDDFHTAGSTNAMRNLLASWPLDEVRAFFERELDVALKVEETGKVFPVSDSAQEVLDALLGEVARAGATLVAGFRVERVDLRESEGSRFFEIASDGGRIVRARRVVIATGGLSVPKTGSDGRGYEVARAFGHSVAATYPALVPLVSSDARFGELAGIAVRVRLRALRGERVLEERRGNLLFTHAGFSGPCVLDLSHHVARGEASGVRVLASWIGEREGDWDVELRAGGKKTIAGVLQARIPRRLAALLCEIARVDGAASSSELSREARGRLVAVLDAFELPIAGNEGYRTAEVTGGGLVLSELSTKTLESRRVPGLYACGEIVDVTGRIGGFNFLWAWISGRLVGRAIARAFAEESAPSG
jgi:predicted Rossmann fold flavoprotein